ncbi:hypothetical protein X975_02225, partial [Stegodyphus mimosarum]
MALRVIVQVDIHYHQESFSWYLPGNEKFSELTPFSHKGVMCTAWPLCNDIQNFHFSITDQLNILGKFPFVANKNKPVIN